MIDLQRTMIILWLETGTGIKEYKGNADEMIDEVIFFYTFFLALKFNDTSKYQLHP